MYGSSPRLTRAETRDACGVAGECAKAGCWSVPSMCQMAHNHMDPQWEGLREEREWGDFVSCPVSHGVRRAFSTGFCFLYLDLSTFSTL